MTADSHSLEAHEGVSGARLPMSYCTEKWCCVEPQINVVSVFLSSQEYRTVPIAVAVSTSPSLDLPRARCNVVGIHARLQNKTTGGNGLLWG